MFVRFGIVVVVVVTLVTVAVDARGAPVEEVVVHADAVSRLAVSGQYAARHTISGSFEGVELDEGVAAAKLDFHVEITNEAGAGFLHGAKGHCIGIALYQPEGPAGSGVCSFKDPDGDVLLMRFVEDPFTSTGTAESTGGTGKYANIEVKQSHRTLDSDQLVGARFEARGVRNGVWQTAVE